MPNPKAPARPIYQHFAIASGWRVAIVFVAGGGYTATLEHLRPDGEWEATGPSARSPLSGVCAAQRLLDGYEGFAQRLRSTLCVGPNNRIDGGCPSCGYTHIDLSEREGIIRWSCRGCGGHGVGPTASRSNA